MARRTFVLCSLLTLLVGGGTGWAAPPRPVPVSPGETGAFSHVAQGCPTFSWGGVEGAVAYELVVFAVDQAVLEESQLAEPRAPRLQVTLPGTALSWTPSMDRCLEAGERYAWLVRALGTGVEEWSQAKVFEVVSRPSIAEVEEALRVLRRYTGEERTASTGAEMPSDGERVRERADRPAESDVRKGPSSQAVDSQAAEREEERPRWRESLLGGTGQAARMRSWAGAEPALGRESIEARTPAPTLGTASLTVDQQVHLGTSSNVFKEGEVLLWDDASFNTALGRRALADNGTGALNTATGADALRNNTTGSFNTASGARPLFYNTTGSSNTATGAEALFYNTTGSRNTATGTEALESNTTGRYNTASGVQALRNNTTGDRNTANGFRALYSNTTGHSNTGLGLDALNGNTTGYGNTASGAKALENNTTGRYNTASGYRALNSNTTGSSNTASGFRAMRKNGSGQFNTAIGYLALYGNRTGSRNVAIGYSAGRFVDVGSDNIFIGNLGGSDDSATIRIGEPHIQTATYIGGIYGGYPLSSALPVFVDYRGQLGTSRSSRRFKEGILDMGRASRPLLDLRPVTFRYKQDLVPGEQAQEYGLIAEEVAEVLPDLVVYDKEGQPFSVRYHLLPSLMLNELQRQERELQDLRGRVVSLEAREVELTTQLHRLAEQRRKRATTHGWPSRPEAPLPLATLAASERRRTVAEVFQ